MKQKELQKVLEKHRLWLGDCGGECADLKGTDLQEAYLGYGDLQGACLGHAYLGYAYLGYADLKGACLPWRSEPKGSRPVNKKKKEKQNDQDTDD